MAKRDFDAWLDGFRDSISGYGYYIDYDKVVKNANSYKVELNILNSLIGSDDIENDFLKLLKDYPKILGCIPELLAVRASEIFAMDEAGEFWYDFSRANQTPEQYAIFMRKTGLFDIISKHLVNNLYDYVLGVETGLDSNGRKNRGGHQMEDLVERFIQEAGLKYYKEMYDEAIQKKFGIDLSRLNNDSQSTKRFDFVIVTNDCVYGVETNFYASGGSKLNETARSYKMLTEEARGIAGFRFLWVTDGNGWRSAKKNLKETFDVLDDIYNIRDLEEGAFKKLRFRPCNALLEDTLMGSFSHTIAGRSMIGASTYCIRTAPRSRRWISTTSRN